MWWLRHQWYEKKYSLFVLVLLPFSFLFYLIIRLRRLSYRFGWMKSHKAPVPVIVVGNITVGGSGKTPVMIALCQRLLVMGYRPGVISRGYGGSYTGSVLVLPDSDPVMVGDEPVLIAQKAKVPVAVGKRRMDAVSALLAKHDCDIILSDDGLQHYALQRDMEIAVVKQLGNRFLLPAGPLREPVSRLKEVGIVIYPQLSGNTLVNLLDTALSKSVSELTNQCIHAVAGIADPQPFFAYLTEMGAKVIPHAFPDHYAFRPADIAFSDELMVVMTEKDAVKCRPFAGDHVWYLPVEAVFEASFDSQFFSQLKEII
jgi:tetraacyldisaccharide 4'-kinase